MYAAVVHAFGQAPRFEEFADPTPAEGEVLVQVLAAGLHPIVRALAAGTHYGSHDQLPMIPGVDGVGRLADGTNVYFGLIRPPYGTMAERAAVSRQMCLPLPPSLEPDTVAALFNPGMSAWLALSWRAQLAKGETVLVLGATGAAGQMAVQLARRFGAGKIIALGRNERVLSQLPALGADVVISLEQPDQAIIEAIIETAGADGVHVIVDYLWGQPTELVLRAIMRHGLTHTAPRVRLIEVGQMAGADIRLPAEVLRSSGLEIYGSGAGTAPVEQVIAAIPQFIELAAGGGLQIGVQPIALAQVESAWPQLSPDNRRVVFVP